MDLTLTQNNEKKYLVIELTLTVLIIAGILIYNFSQKISISECSNQDGYCIYKNIPPYLKHTLPNEEIPENFIANRQDVLTQYFKRTASEIRDISEAFGLDPDKYVCLNGDKITTINYFYDLCGGFEGMEGCGYNRKAIICEGIYFIEQYSDSTGSVMYGPFNLE